MRREDFFKGAELFVQLAGLLAVTAGILWRSDKSAGGIASITSLIMAIIAIGCWCAGTQLER